MGETFSPHGGTPIFENRQIRKSFFEIPPPPPPQKKKKNHSFSDTTFAERVSCKLSRLPNFLLGPFLLLADLPHGCQESPKICCKNEKSVFREGGWGGGGGVLTCTSPGPRQPQDPGLVFFVLSFHKFYPCIICARLE